MIKISIVVPVYNAEKFVQTPLESLLGKQDIDSLEYEIVCVNDGSTDNSLSVLDSYKKRYENVRVVTQKNKGLGGARNTGIDNSKGKYILFVDADDYICDKSLKQLFNKAENGNLDILEFGAQGVSLAGVVKYTSTINMESDILTGEEYLSKILYMDSACNKLYKRSLLEDNNLKFLERVYIEDIEFNTRAVFCAKRVQAIPTIIGQFVLTEGSITRSTGYKKQLKMMKLVFIQKAGKILIFLGYVNQKTGVFLVNYGGDIKFPFLIVPIATINGPRKMTKLNVRNVSQKILFRTRTF